MGQGASQAVFTSSAKGNFFTKLTTFLAIAFMVNSIILTTLKTKTSNESLFDDEAPVAAPLNSDVEAGNAIPTEEAAPKKEEATEAETQK